VVLFVRAIMGIVTTSRGAEVMIKKGGRAGGCI
jgi:hypothetical protein